MTKRITTAAREFFAALAKLESMPRDEDQRIQATTYADATIDVERLMDDDKIVVHVMSPRGAASFDFTHCDDALHTRFVVCEIDESEHKDFVRFLKKLATVGIVPAWVVAYAEGLTFWNGL